MIACQDLPQVIDSIDDALTLRPELLAGKIYIDSDIPEIGTLPLPVLVPYVLFIERPWYKGGDKKICLQMLVKDYWYRGICIPAGFLFNGVSIPRVFWRVWTPFSPAHSIASLVHDWLYFTGILSRKQCDQLFREILLLTYNGGFKSGTMYRALRIGGSSSYNNK